jgi:hypothetical protein
VISARASYLGGPGLKFLARKPDIVTELSVIFQSIQANMGDEILTAVTMKSIIS